MSIASVNASVQGAMAQVVQRSTQYLSATDLQAMAVYLKALPGGFAATTSANLRPFARLQFWAAQQR